MMCSVQETAAKSAMSTATNLRSRKQTNEPYASDSEVGVLRFLMLERTHGVQHRQRGHASLLRTRARDVVDAPPELPVVSARAVGARRSSDESDDGQTVLFWAHDAHVRIGPRRSSGWISQRAQNFLKCTEQYYHDSAAGMDRLLAPLTRSEKVIQQYTC